jgi:hypothetical protein
MLLFALQSLAEVRRRSSWGLDKPNRRSEDVRGQRRPRSLLDVMDVTQLMSSAIEQLLVNRTIMMAILRHVILRAGVIYTHLSFLGKQLEIFNYLKSIVSSYHGMEN